MKILITSGGCKAPIDEVRHIGNFSSGYYGANLAAEFYDIGDCQINFFHERGSKSPWGKENGSKWDHSRSVKISYDSYKFYEDYLKVKDIIKDWQPDIIISAAAVADYIPVKQEGRISSDAEEITITLKKAEKVIASFRELAPNALIVGFKCLVSPTKEEREKAITKLFNHVDYVIYNDLTELRKGNTTRRMYDYFDNGECAYKDCKTASDLVREILMNYNNIKMLRDLIP